jgi:hypothetical protein
MEVLIVKKNARKLVLSRETLRTLDDSGLKVQGGILPPQQGLSKRDCPTIDDTRQVSICLTCTGTLDGCPPNSNGCA